MTAAIARDRAWPARLNDLALFAMMLAISGILTTAMVLQLALPGELPCPLCLLQRVAMFGVCFGLAAHARHGYAARNIGLSLIWALVLLVVSVRQVLLDICPRPGHAYVGSAVLGLHMGVWSVVIAAALLAGLATTLTLFGDARLREAAPSPLLSRLGGWASLYVIALCAINLVAVVLQCGFGACHTSGYALL